MSDLSRAHAFRAEMRIKEGEVRRKSRTCLRDLRAESIHAVHAILTRAASLHPADVTIQFNLACYEAQMGNLDRAKAHLKQAIEIEEKFRLMALEDPDLEPLSASLATD